ncbi:MAG: hypothetical protein AMXMBFR23_04390 [Chloroflexota bacterium]
MIPDEELLRPLVAGWISGAAAAMFITPVLVIWAARPGPAARFQGRSRLPVLVILFLNGLSISLTLIGLVLGAIYHASGGRPFVIGMLGSLAVLAAAYVIVRGRVRTGEAPAVLISLAILAACLGGLLPVLAERR